MCREEVIVHWVEDEGQGKLDCMWQIEGAMTADNVYGVEACGTENRVFSRCC